MVLPISGFMPVPLAMMIPFMFMQSVMMGYGFGTGFQYSKRKISAMNNEEFNATSIPKEVSKMFEAYKLMLPDIQQSIRDSKDLQVTVVEEMVKIPAHLLNALLGTTTEGSSTSDSPAPVPTIGSDAPKTAADVFKETPDEPKIDLFDPNRQNIPLDSSVDVLKWSEHNVYRHIWWKSPLPVPPPIERKKLARNWFYSSFIGYDVRYLVVQKLEEFRNKNVDGVVYFEFKVIFYID